MNWYLEDVVFAVFLVLCGIVICFILFVQAPSESNQREAYKEICISNNMSYVDIDSTILCVDESGKLYYFGDVE